MRARGREKNPSGSRPSSRSLRPRFPSLIAVRDWLAFTAAHELTRREAQVLERISRGYGNLELCEELGVAPPTLRSHVRKAYAKVGCRDRVELILLIAHRYGVAARRT